MDRRRVASDLRFRIDDLFREAGIVIAFPQRDVHLDSARPIEVRLLDTRSGGTPPEEREA
jgi:small-conductance mechanosensitive channel